MSTTNLFFLSFFVLAPALGTVDTEIQVPSIVNPVLTKLNVHPLV